MVAESDAKLAKKEAKRLKKAQKQSVSQSVDASVPEAAIVDEPELKQKKKKQKKAAIEVSQVVNDESGAAEATDGKEKKKKKKRKKEANDVENLNDVNGIQDEKPKKKSKKDKLGGDSADLPTEKQQGRVVQQIEENHLARIGDKDLVTQSEPIQKAYYQENDEVSNTSAIELRAWLKERAIVVEGSSVRPIFKFSQSGLPQSVLHATRTFTSPSPIQAQCIPLALSGRDLVGIAATGSGKTLAFGLPCLRHIQGQRDSGHAQGKHPKALMLSPTRELAQQIASVMEEAGKLCNISTLCVYGGVPKHPQAAQLRKGIDIVVATPGRLEDLMNDGACKLHLVSYLVLDEADRMLDLGFEPHIRAIASKTRADRQTLMFSATWPTEVQKLALDYLSSPVRITIGSESLSASHSVTQIVEVIEERDREKRLPQLLEKYHKSRKNRVLVFVLYKKEASRVEERLKRSGWKAASIHGDISQNQRSKAVEDFKSGAIPLLIATDVAARGLDIPDVEAVINYSFPLTTEDYVHRIGRTGRAGKTGIAHTFFVGVNDKARSGELINVLKEAGQTVPENLLAFGTTTKKKESKLYGAHFKEIDPSAKATKIVFDD